MRENARLITDRRSVDGTELLAVRGELDLATAATLGETIREIEGAMFDRIVLDLRDLAFMDCAGLRVIISADEHARRIGCQLRVWCSPGQVSRIFIVSGAVDRLDISIELPSEQLPATAV